MSTDASKDNDKVQLLQNLYGMIAEMNAATLYAACFAKTTLEGASPDQVVSNGPKAKVLEMGLDALRTATAAAVAINELSEKAVRLSQEIQRGQQLNE